MALCIAPLIASASTPDTGVEPNAAFTSLHSFGGVDGQYPASSQVEASDGNFYGTTLGGGSFGVGVVYRMAPNGAVTLLHSFNEGDGSQPYSQLLQASDGNLYGTTTAGGAFSGGTLFRISLDGAFTLLHSFSRDVDGDTPQSPLIQGSDGRLYGTTTYHGIPGGGYGTIFTSSLSGNVRVLYAFAGQDGGGRNPYGLVQLADGGLYGVTPVGGSVGRGTIYRLTRGRQLQLLHDFVDLSEGQNPFSVLLYTNGALYGTCSGGGAGRGTAFSLSSSGKLTVLHTYMLVGTDPASPTGGFVKGAGSILYGTSKLGGAIYGSVYSMTLGGQVTVLHGFTGSDGISPQPPTMGRDGQIYGAAQFGGIGDGSLWRVQP